MTLLLKKHDKFLYNFSPFAGHFGNGFASFPGGNDQESTSESMQFNSSLIHWGTITNQDDIRDLGIYLYTTDIHLLMNIGLILMKEILNLINLMGWFLEYGNT